jgi:hypothetical protein
LLSFVELRLSKSNRAKGRPIKPKDTQQFAEKHSVQLLENLRVKEERSKSFEILLSC